MKKLSAEAKKKAAKAKLVEAARQRRRNADMRLVASQRKPNVHIDLRRVFEAAKPAPNVVPAGAPTLAMDEQIQQSVQWAAAGFGANYPAWAFSEGLAFLGYPYLSELSQRPEYRRLVELIATEMTRKWIKLKTKGKGKKKNKKLSEIEDELIRLNAQGVFRKIVEQDGFFGRSHLYLDFGVTDEPEELLTPIGNGNDKFSKGKIQKGSLKALRTVEAVWTYPTDYNSNDPLRDDWYKPTIWYVMGKRVHASRLFTFIGREVPDLLKPAYSFGGLALTQMIKPYVDNWLQTRQSVSDIISAFTTYVLKTNMQADLNQDGDILQKRAAEFNNWRSNAGLLIVDKATEDFSNVAAPLAGLDTLQAQSQEHICSVSGTPVVKYLGIQPAGLNSSSEGEIKSWYDWVTAYQHSLLRPQLTRLIHFVQLSLYSEVDEEIDFDFEPLEEMTEKELAELEESKAKTAETLISVGVIDAEEERERLSNDTKSPYNGITPSDVPDLMLEEEQGLEPEGGRPQPQAQLPAQQQKVKPGEKTKPKPPTAGKQETKKPEGKGKK